mmetsp:Transcript_15338/g.18107  ORF Transcript_15338/g.18107 Transcript_15338/m.18107 type:complete len:352 (+) Transcript_15338:779-1834(+)
MADVYINFETMLLNLIVYSNLMMKHKAIIKHMNIYVIYRRTDDGPEHNISYNEPSNENIIEFETKVFKGKAMLRFRGCPNEPTSYFEGRKRRQQWVVQGQFKHAISAAHQVVTGYEFKRKAVNLPTKYIIKPILTLIRTLAPTFRAEIFGGKPYFLNPFLQTVQNLDVSRPGSEPDITKEFEENNKLLGGVFANGEPVDRIKRKSYFASDENGQQHTFDPELMYTFDFYEDRFDPALFQLVLPFASIDITTYLDSQPLTLMGKICDPNHPYHGHYLFNFELFHESQHPENESKDVAAGAYSSWWSLGSSTESSENKGNGTDEGSWWPSALSYSNPVSNSQEAGESSNSSWW